MVTPNTPVYILAGPTASGKSALALELAAHYDGVIINADSMQIYREIPVITAQPSATDQRQAPHLLYGFLSVTQNYSAADWALAALAAIRATLAEKRVPILVGGSGLYIKALTEGFSPMPDVPAAVRKQCSDLYDMLGPQGFHEALAKIDPASAGRLHPTDRQRCIRAREIYEASNEPLSHWQAKPKQLPCDDLRFRALILMPERDWLYERINERFTQMIGRGALAEAKILNAMDLNPLMTGAKAVGLQALRDHLEGRLTLAEAVETGQTLSRQYAKRQFTWFKNQSLPQAHLLAAPVFDQAVFDPLFQ